MKRKITTRFLASVSMLAFSAVGASAAPADGQCVSNGVQALGGKSGAKLIGAVASSQDPAPVQVIILDHVFNGADVTESILGVTICD